MEEFLGVLFCGGKGNRLREITNYISKPFVPIYDKPVFKFGLELLERSSLIKEIIILSNKDNDAKLNKLGYRTIIQDDSKVNDMFTGWEYIEKITGTKMNGVLVPGDNISEMNIDELIKKFQDKNADFLFSIHELTDKKKLSMMGCFDIETKKFYYKHPEPPSDYGVIAPYIIRNNFISETDSVNKAGKNIFETENSEIVFHKGIWFDIGDYESIIAAGNWRYKNK